MKKYVIITESNTDLPDSFAKENDLVILPMMFHMDGKDYRHYLDEREILIKDFYQLQKDGKVSTTSQANSEDFMNLFMPYVNSDTPILYICFSSGLSGTLNSARIAKETILEDYPNAVIEIIDSKLASMGEGLLVYYAIKYKEAGMSLEENYAALNTLRDKIVSWFTVGDIETLRRGGRVSNVAAFVAKLANIKPVLHVSEEGKLVPRTKKIGRKVSLKELIVQMEERFIKEENDIIFISHGDCLEDALYIQKLIEEKFDFHNFMIAPIGPVIGSHSGPDTVAIFYIGTHR